MRCDYEGSFSDPGEVPGPIVSDQDNIPTLIQDLHVTEIEHMGNTVLVGNGSGLTKL